MPAGTYHVECDGIVIGAVDVTFTLIWRHGGAGGTDTALAEWTRHWDPLPGGNFDAQAYEVDMAAPAIAFEAGDQLVFRYAGSNTTTPQAWIPNSDGALAHGRIPSIRLPH